MNGKRRVVVSGMGVVSPIGLDEASFWRSMVEGRSAIRRISAYGADGYRTVNAAEVDNAALNAALAANKLKASDRTLDMALLASIQALEAAGVIVPGEAPVRRNIATIVGSGGGPAWTVEEAYDRFTAKGMDGIKPTTVVRMMNNMIPSRISMKFRLGGPNFVVSSACSSSTNAIGIGFRMIRDGYADLVLCGGTESCLAPKLYAAWDKLGVLSPNPDPAAASRPFDSKRDGFVMGEGAGMLVLEERGAALKRGAGIRGEIAGFGESSDAEHIVRPSEEGQTQALRMAIADSGTSLEEIGYINAQGTGTLIGDECEARSIAAVFGDLAGEVLVGSSKSFFGHLLGASGVVETIAVLLALETGIAPPNLNLTEPDPRMGLRFAGARTEEIRRSAALNNSFAFGGSNAVLLLLKSQETN